MNVTRHGFVMLALVLVSLTTKGVADQGDEGSEKKPAAGPFRCVYNVKCWPPGNPTQIIMDHDVECTHPSDEALAKQCASNSADGMLTSCEMQGLEGQKTFVGCVEGLSASMGARFECVLTCTTGNGHDISVGRIAGTATDAEAAAWARLVFNAKLQGGLVADSIRSLVRQPIYLCSVQVRCLDEPGKVTRSFEVTVHGPTESAAKEALELAVDRVIQEHKGEDPQRVDATESCQTLVGVLPEEVLTTCYYKCETYEDRSIIVSRRRVGEAAAFGAAADAAHFMSQGHGGTRKCGRIEPHEQDDPLP